MIFDDCLPWTCWHYFTEFCNRYDKPKCNSVHYIFTQFSSQFSPHFSKFSFIVFIQFSPVSSFGSIHKKSGNPKMRNLQLKSWIWIMKTGLEMESRIKQDCSSKVKIIRTLSSDSICVLSVFFFAVNLLLCALQ